MGNVNKWRCSTWHFSDSAYVTILRQTLTSDRILFLLRQTEMISKNWKEYDLILVNCQIWSCQICFLRHGITTEVGRWIFPMKFILYNMTAKWARILLYVRAKIRSPSICFGVGCFPCSIVVFVLPGMLWRHLNLGCIWETIIRDRSV